LNANIEAARLGVKGAGFEVIASQMRRLTDQVDSANRQVEQIARALLSSLPKIVEHNDRMCRSTEAFGKELSETVQRANSAAQHLKDSVAGVLSKGDKDSHAILSGSHHALSHLQFQDPVAQSLVIIDADLQKLRERITELLAEAGVHRNELSEALDTPIERAEAHRELNAGEVTALEGEAPADAGEVLLF
jgi:methyl-accepting chemotaxis protein